MLPALDTASFDAELPLSSRKIGHAAALSQTARLTLQVLAAPEAHEDDSEASIRLEAKLNLLLETVLRSATPYQPLARRCRIGLDALAWEDVEAYAPGDHVELTLFPNHDSALMLPLPLTIVQADVANGQFLYLGRLKPVLEDEERDLWEKWVFRRHRRSLQKRQG
jgi:hypothetical protein